MFVPRGTKISHTQEGGVGIFLLTRGDTKICTQGRDKYLTQGGGEDKHFNTKRWANIFTLRGNKHFMLDTLVALVKLVTRENLSKVGNLVKEASNLFLVFNISRALDSRDVILDFKNFRMDKTLSCLVIQNAMSQGYIKLRFFLLHQKFQYFC